MARRYLLDSDVLIWFLRGRADTVALVKELKGLTIPGCSALSTLEVMGWVRPKEEDDTRDFLDSLQLFPFEADAAFLAAQYMRQYRAKGKSLTPFDTGIAATCVVHDLMLVTYNTKDFPMSELKIYPMLSHSAPQKRK